MALNGSKVLDTKWIQTICLVTENHSVQPCGLSGDVKYKRVFVLTCIRSRSSRDSAKFPVHRSTISFMEELIQRLT